MVIETLILMALKAGLAAAVAVVVLACLTYQRIVDWFQSKTAMKDIDKSSVGFSLQERMDTGKYKTVYGVYSKKKNKVLEGVEAYSETIDEELARTHAGSPMVVYK